ncbi:MAG: hypothetical protein ACJ8FM_16635, partial [Xanthobacteraceae bacterium]
MPSEYDFLLPYSRGLRRTGRLILVGAAFVAGVASTALIVALPLRHVSNEKVTASSAQTEKANSADRGEKIATTPTKNAAPPAQPQQQPSPQPRVAGSEKPVDRTAGSTGTWTETQAAAASNVSPDRPRETSGVAAPAAKPPQATASPPPAPAPQAAPNPAPATSTPAEVVTNNPSSMPNNEQPAVNNGEAAIADSAAVSDERPAARASETRTTSNKRKPSGTSVTGEQAAMISGTSSAETREKPVSRTSERRRSKDKPAAPTGDPAAGERAAALSSGTPSAETRERRTATTGESQAVQATRNREKP